MTNAIVSAFGRSLTNFDIFQRERLVSKLAHRSEAPSMENSAKIEKKKLWGKPRAFDKSPGILCVFYGSLHFFFGVGYEQVLYFGCLPQWKHEKIESQLLLFSCQVR